MLRFRLSKATTSSFFLLLPSSYPTLLTSNFVFTSFKHSSTLSIRERIQKERERLVQQQTQTELSLQQEDDEKQQQQPSKMTKEDETQVMTNQEQQQVEELEEQEDFINEEEDDEETLPFIDSDGNRTSMTSEEAKFIYEQRKQVVENIRERKSERDAKRAQWLIWQAGQREKGFESTVRRKISKQVARRRLYHHAVGGRMLPAGNQLMPVNMQHSSAAGYHLDYNNPDFIEKNDEKKKNIDDFVSSTVRDATRYQNFPDKNNNKNSSNRFSGRNKSLFMNQEVVKPKNDDLFSEEGEGKSLNKKKKELSEDDLLFEGHNDFYFGASSQEQEKNREDLKRNSKLLLRQRMFNSDTKSLRNHVSLDDYWGRMPNYTGRS